jgi:hypothetical protein
VHIYRFIEEEATQSNPATIIPLTSQETEYHRGEEWNVIHGQKSDNFSENTYRKEVGLPLRVTHHAIPSEMDRRIKTAIGKQSPIRTTESEKNLRIALEDIFKNGLEAEARAAVKNCNLNFSDLDFLFDVELLNDYCDREKQMNEGIKELDSIRKHIASLFVSAALQNTSDPIKAEEFGSKLFVRSSFRSLDFQKKLCSLIPLDIILTRTPIVQNAIEEENSELIAFLISEKGLKQDHCIGDKDSSESLTIDKYAQECEWDAITELFTVK